MSKDTQIADCIRKATKENHQKGVHVLLWFSVDQAVLLAGQADCGGVDQGRHDVHVLRDDFVEEFLIPVEELHHVDVLVQVVVPAVDVAHHAKRLLVLVDDGRGQEPMDTQDLPLFQRESHTLYRET